MLVEALIASAVLAMAASAVYLSIASAQAQMHYASHVRRAMSLVEEMLQYVTVMPYDDPDGPSSPGPESGEGGISLFDNMDDFDGYAEARGELKDVAGNSYPAAHQSFSRSISAQYTSETVNELGGAIPGLLVTVTVQDQRGESWSVARFVAEPAN